jgi:hypothetical protein
MVDVRFGGNKGENIVPRAVVVIGGTPTIPLSYDITMNNFMESDTASIKFPLELINIASLLTVNKQAGAFVTVEIWSGFISATSKQHTYVQSNFNMKSNDQIKKDLLKTYKDDLQLRWFGILEQPEFNLSVEQPSLISFSCREIITLLQDIYYEKKFEGDSATVDFILKDIVNSLGRTVKLKVNITDKERLRLNMGAKFVYKKKEDTREEKAVEYNTVGKTYYQVLEEIIKKASLMIEQSTTDPYTYIISDLKSSNTLWTLDRIRDWADIRIREGEYGGTGNKQLNVIARSVQSKGETVEAFFPRNFNGEITEGTRIKTIKIAPNKDKDYCEKIAIQYATAYQKLGITGDVVIPNAITGLKPHHLIKFKDSSTLNIKLPKYYESVKFRVNSIKESYSKNSGLRQDSVEFELDELVNITKFDPKGKFTQVDYKEYFKEIIPTVESSKMKFDKQEEGNPFKRGETGLVQ